MTSDSNQTSTSDSSVQAGDKPQKACSSCAQLFTPDDVDASMCDSCRERQTAIWVAAIFAILLFCFVVLPLMVQWFDPRDPATR